MHIAQWIFLAVFGACIVLSSVVLCDGAKAYRAVIKMRAASRTFISWRLRNQGVYLGLSDTGKRLLRAWLRAVDEVEETHPACDFGNLREWIISLFDDFPPNSPESFPVIERPLGARFYPRIKYTTHHVPTFKSSKSRHYRA